MQEPGLFLVTWSAHLHEVIAIQVSIHRVGCYIYR